MVMKSNAGKGQFDNEVLDSEAIQRRKFIEKFGKLAVITPVAVTALMSPSTSAAPKSGCNKHGRGCKS